MQQRYRGIIDLSIVSIDGFRNEVGDLTGQARLYWRLRQTFAHTPRHFTMQRAWHDDFAGTANTIAQHIARDQWGNPTGKTAVIAYSWGAGRGMHRLASELGRHGLPINLLFLIDPVPFAKWNAPALLTCGTFKLPKNVRQTWCWRQVNKQSLFDPMGRSPRPRANTATSIVRETVYGTQADLAKQGVEQDAYPYPVVICDGAMRHNTIDDCTDIHDEIVNIIRQRVPCTMSNVSPHHAVIPESQRMHE